MSGITGQDYMMRQWLAPEADRLARLIHWSVLTPPEARHEIRATARRSAARGRLSLDPDRIADDVLAEEYWRQDAAHAATMARLVAIGGRTLNRGGTPGQARTAIADAAIAAKLPPPVALLEQALHRAATEHRRSLRWQARMAGAMA